MTSSDQHVFPVWLSCPICVSPKSMGIHGEIHPIDVLNGCKPLVVSKLLVLYYTLWLFLVHDVSSISMIWPLQTRQTFRVLRKEIHPLLPRVTAVLHFLAAGTAGTDHARAVTSGTDNFVTIPKPWVSCWLWVIIARNKPGRSISPYILPNQ